MIGTLFLYHATGHSLFSLFLAGAILALIALFLLVAIFVVLTRSRSR